jgi:hypothetical protein
MIHNVFQDLGADNDIEIVILEGQAGHVRNRKPPHSPAVFTQLVLKFESLSGFGQVLEIQIGSDGDDIPASISCTGVTTGTATDV